jgi:hypothetical protein
MKRRTTRIVARGAMSALLALACARRERIPLDPNLPTPEADSTRAARPAPVPLRVDNRYRADVVIYALRGTARVRLGTVTSAATGSLVIPATFVNDPGGLVLVADPVGGRTSLQSERFIVRTGQRVEWSLESSFARSSLGVY